MIDARSDEVAIRKTEHHYEVKGYSIFKEIEELVPADHD